MSYESVQLKFDIYEALLDILTNPQWEVLIYFIQTKKLTSRGRKLVTKKKKKKKKKKDGVTEPNECTHIRRNNPPELIDFKC